MVSGRRRGRARRTVSPGARSGASVTIFRSNAAPPDWCALRSFEVLDLGDGATAARTVAHRKERLLCSAGTVQIAGRDGSVVLKEGQFLDAHAHPGMAGWTAKGCAAGSQLVRLSGAWGEDVAGCGIFRVANDPAATDKGDPVDYPKSTRVDCHYHDCDEYWLLLEGAATVVVGGRFAEMKPGDCLAIGMGHHHDMPAAPEPVKAVFFETTLEGRKRIGHLWNHTHGPAQPKAERV